MLVGKWSVHLHVVRSFLRFGASAGLGADEYSPVSHNNRQRSGSESLVLSAPLPSAAAGANLLPPGGPRSSVGPGPRSSAGPVPPTISQASTPGVAAHLSAINPDRQQTKKSAVPAARASGGSADDLEDLRSYAQQVFTLLKICYTDPLASSHKIHRATSSYWILVPDPCT